MTPAAGPLRLRRPVPLWTPLALLVAGLWPLSFVALAAGAADTAGLRALAALPTLAAVLAAVVLFRRRPPHRRVSIVLAGVLIGLLAALATAPVYASLSSAELGGAGPEPVSETTLGVVSLGIFAPLGMIFGALSGLALAFIGLRRPEPPPAAPG